MSIVLAILKWIGIVIGVILGLLFLLVGILLFIPVRYYVEAEKDEKKFAYGFTVSWLCHLVAFQKKKNAEKFSVRILGIPVGGGILSGKDKTVTSEPAAAEKEESVPEKTEPKSTKADKKQKIEKATKRKEAHRKGRKKTSKKHFSFDKFSSIIKEIRDAGNRRAVKVLWGEFWQLLRYLSPRKVKLDMVIGTGDPCNTGLLFGGISMVPWVYNEGVHIVPDFEEKAFQLKGYIKGRVRVVYFIRLLLRLYRNQDLKRFYNHILKKEAA